MVSNLRFKLLQLGICTKFYNIIKSLYNGSQPCVRLGNGVTNPFKLGVGVRQGDILRRNLFKIFINVLPAFLQSCPDPMRLSTAYLHCLIYADEVVLLSASAAGMQDKLKRLEEFCDDWRLNVNTDKTKIIVFNKAGRIIKSKFKFKNEIIDGVSSYRYLGLYFSASGSFSYTKSELYI